MQMPGRNEGETPSGLAVEPEPVAAATRDPELRDDAATPQLRALLPLPGTVGPISVPTGSCPTTALRLLHRLERAPDAGAELLILRSQHRARQLPLPIGVGGQEMTVDYLLLLVVKLDLRHPKNA